MQDISLHILDIAENSVAAGSTLIVISLSEDTEADSFTVEISDNGRGIPEEVRARVLDPFFTTRTTRPVGLGLSLLAQAAKETGGNVAIRSREPSGTIVTALFRPSHIDMKPIGNMVDTLVILMTGNPHIDIVFSYKRNGSGFSLDTREIKQELGGIPINSSAVVSFLRNLLTENIG